MEAQRGSRGIALLFLELELDAGKRLLWSRGKVLAFSTQVPWFKPGRSRQIFKGEKFLSTPSHVVDLRYVKDT
jgi:hypothetical protein